MPLKGPQVWTRTGVTREDVQNPVYKRPKPSLSQGGLGFTNLHQS